MKPISISTKEAEFILRQSKGKVFSVSFYKKDGTLRKLQGRLGVKKDLKGCVNTVKAYTEYLTVYEMHVGYRNVNLNTIDSITFCGKTYKVISNE
jgi:hypothetical protein